MISRFEKEILVAHALCLTRAQLIAKRTDELDAALYQPLLDRRAKHEPTAYIVGYQPFWGLDFIVDRSVLIPRPETELLVEKVIESYSHYLPAGRHGALPVTRISMADIGTGSGCIAITLAKNLPNVTVIGVDSSKEALKIAQKNAEYHGVADRCRFITGDMLEEFTTKAPRRQETQKLDIIVSNPPYIPTEVIETLEPEVKDWEPRQALGGGKDGLNYIRKLIVNAPNHLSIYPSGSLFLEIGFHQGPAVIELAEQTGRYSDIKIVKDLNGQDRIFTARVK